MGAPCLRSKSDYPVIVWSLTPSHTRPRPSVSLFFPLLTTTRHIPRLTSSFRRFSSTTGLPPLQGEDACSLSETILFLCTKAVSLCVHVSGPRYFLVPYRPFTTLQSLNNRRVETVVITLLPNTLNVPKGSETCQPIRCPL